MLTAEDLAQIERVVVSAMRHVRTVARALPETDSTGLDRLHASIYSGEKRAAIKVSRAAPAEPVTVDAPWTPEELDALDQAETEDAELWD